MQPLRPDRSDPEDDDGDSGATGTSDANSDDEAGPQAPARTRLGEVISRTLQDESFVHPRLKGLSELLVDATEGHAAYITLAELVQRLSARGLAPVVLVISLLNMVSLIPGSTAILGLPLLFLGVSLMIGAKSLWLPHKLRGRNFERTKLEAMVRRIIPHIQKLERLAHPRYWPGTNGLTDRVYGAFVFCLGLIVTLPIPFGNMLPALAIALVSLGMMARDGLWVLAGTFLATLSVGVVIGVAGAVTVAGARIFGG